jgi:hypothetical protein
MIGFVISYAFANLTFQFLSYVWAFCHELVLHNITAMKILKKYSRAFIAVYRLHLANARGKALRIVGLITRKLYGIIE